MVATSDTESSIVEVCSTRMATTQITDIVFDFGGVLHVVLDKIATTKLRDELAAVVGFNSGKEFRERVYQGEEWKLSKRGKIPGSELWDRVLIPLGMTDEQGM